MKLYTFTDKNGEIITQVRANNHDEALKTLSTTKKVNFMTDFYSENLCPICEGIEDTDGRCGCTNKDSN
jgi:hypothetical protein